MIGEYIYEEGMGRTIERVAAGLDNTQSDVVTAVARSQGPAVNEVITIGGRPSMLMLRDREIRRIGKQYDLIHFHGGVFALMAAARTARHMPTVATVYGVSGLPSIREWRQLGWKSMTSSNVLVPRVILARMIPSWVQRRAVRQIGKVLSHDQRWTERIQNNNPDTQLQLLYPGAQSSQKTRARFEEHSPEVIFLGRSERVRGLEVLIEAFAGVREKLPQAQLTLCLLETKEWEELREVCVGQPGVNVITDPLADPESRLAEAQVGVWPYLADHTTSPPALAPVEALAVGLPVVGSNVACLVGVLNGGEVGAAVAPGEAAQLTEAVVRLLEDQESWEKASKAAVAHSRRFSWTRYVEAVAETYDAALERWRRPGGSAEEAEKITGEKITGEKITGEKNAGEKIEVEELVKTPVGGGRFSPQTEARYQLLDDLKRCAENYPGDWAFQGVKEAPQRWAEDEGVKDLDVWVRNEKVAAGLSSVIKARGGMLITKPAHQPRVTHQQWWVPMSGGGAVIDLTVGGLGGGPTIVIPAEQVQAADGRFTGQAAVYDLVGRPLMRGEVPAAERVEAAAEQYRELDKTSKQLKEWPAALRWATRAAMKTPAKSGSAAGGSVMWARLIRARMVAVTAAHPAASWANRHEIFGRHKSPVSGLAARGVVVAFIGADGSGKTTMADAVAEALRCAGETPGRMYLGMVRDNWKTAAAMRRVAHKVLGVQPETPEKRSEETQTTPAENSTANTPEDNTEAPRTEPGAAEKILRWAGAWVYGVDLALRVRKARKKARGGEVVLVDRWTYDLAHEPWEGHAAGRMLSRVHPDVLILCDGDPAAMWARKPEGSATNTTNKQAQYRRHAGQAARRGVQVIRIDTVAGAGVAAEADHVMRQVVAASHRVELEKRPA